MDNDIMHNKAFMTAGAQKTDLLMDFRTAAEKAIMDGATLHQFQKDFDAIVKKHGWDYHGSRNWRSRIIYETNVRQAHNAGRERRRTAGPELRARRPYGLYRHGDSVVPRPEHPAWDGTAVPLDDPWRNTHTPQNGWGCKCKKFTLSKKDVERMGATVQRPQTETYKWLDKRTGKIHNVPQGIDPGFDYTPGKNDVQRLRG
ncbi:MAG: hypothetical protein GY862_12000, partial [Gammaproteobacteria bacterium]|nr:hypothetical protein [Gammaproteobacteria bacterium]